MTNKLSLRVVLVSVALVLLAGAVGSALLPTPRGQEKELQGSERFCRSVTTPDIATSPFGRNQNESAQLAARENAELMTNVMAALKELGLTGRSQHKRLQRLSYQAVEPQ